MRSEDLTAIERAGRRCTVCHSGRGWRRFELVRLAGREPAVLCGSCRARVGDDPPVGRKLAPALEPVQAAAEPLSPPQPRASERGSAPRPSRLLVLVPKDDLGGAWRLSGRRPDRLQP